MRHTHSTLSSRPRPPHDEVMPIRLNIGAAAKPIPHSAAAQQHGQAYVLPLLEHAQRGELTPASLATHRFSLEDGPKGYDMFKHNEDGCLRAVFMP